MPPRLHRLLDALLWTAGARFSSCGYTITGQPDFADFVAALRRRPPPVMVEFPDYAVAVHHPAVASLLKPDYGPDDLRALADFTAPARRIDTVARPWGTFVQAASFVTEDKAQATNYDAVWVRDSVWAALALKAEPDRAADARAVLLSQWDYMAAPAQRQRLDDAIRYPTLLDGDDGQMLAVHIRFNSRSAMFDDVEADGQPQEWTHKQNDALGLLLHATLAALDDGLLAPADLAGPRAEAMVRLAAYLDVQRYHASEDSGAWEELARLNTSSVGLCAAALASLAAAVRRGGDFARELARAAAALGLDAAADPERLDRLAAKGLARVRAQLAAGGESPAYPRTDPRYREGDAALLNLVYPAVPPGITLAEKYRIMELVDPLVGPYGVRRYKDDDYQSGNFWFHEIKTDTDAANREKRKHDYIPGTEAQWFFDSWCALAWHRLHRESGDPADRCRAVRHLNRALGQITGAAPGHDLLAADGLPTPAFALPESYNLVVDQDDAFPVPSPINPLNWAKASMTLMFKEFAGTLS